MREKEDEPTGKPLHDEEGLLVEPRKLTLAEVRVFRFPNIALFESKAIRNVMSLPLCVQLHFYSTDRKRRKIVADSSKAVVVGEVLKVLVSVRAATTEMCFLDVRLTPYSFVIGETLQDRHEVIPRL